MSYFRKSIEAMEAYAPGEQPQDDSFIKLNTNENPYPPSPKVAEALAAVPAELLRKYPDPAATEVRTVVAKLAKTRIENVICGNGSDDLLSIAVRAIVDPGQPLATPYPTYSLYETLAAQQNAVLESHECDAAFGLPAEELAASKAPLVIVANPNAPTGIAAPTKTLRQIAQGISGILLVDEAYADFAEGDAMQLAREEPNVLVMRTLSKSYSLAGIRFGYMVGRAELIAELMKVKDSYNCDRLSIAVARAALEDQAWMQRNVAKIRDARQSLATGLRRLKFEVLDSQANFVLAKPPTGSARDLYVRLKESGFLVRFFDRRRVDAYVRITVGTPEQTQLLLGRIESIVGQ